MDGQWLSIVIPLYNCESYITTSLDSILQQGLAEYEYEVIVVNDGSTDKGADIVARYCESHKNFSLVNNGHGGISIARNTGMDKANGEYIYFMDADDRLLPNGMRILRDSYLEGKEHPDMLTFWSHTVDNHYDAAQFERISSHHELFRGTFYEYANKNNPNYSSVWSRIFSRTFLQKHGLKFNPDAQCAEDALFLMHLFEIPDGRIVTTNLNIYRYIVRGSSMITSVNGEHLKKVLKSFLEVFREMQSLKGRTIYDGTWIESGMDNIRRMFFTRLLSAPFSFKELKYFIQIANECGLYPIPNAQTKVYKVINALAHCPLAAYFVGLPFRYVFIPYIKPALRRN